MMSDTEDVIYQHMTAGEWDEIEEMRASVDPMDADAYRQFLDDYNKANERYQADNEIPEEERVDLTAEAVHQENLDAPEETAEEK